MFQVHDLGKAFEGRWALRHVDVHMPRGTFWGILGRNGAGKTTLVRLLTGQLGPSEGQAHIAGLDVASRPIALRRRLGVMPEPEALLDDLTGHQYLGFVGRIHGLEGRVVDARVAELSEMLSMAFDVPTRIADYSFGMRKKTALAACLLHGPEVLVLDEPFEGLDPVSALAVQALLSDIHGRGATLLLTSHLLGTAERLCDHYLVVHDGRVLAQGTAKELLHGEEDLEGLFLRLVGGAARRRLSWM